MKFDRNAVRVLKAVLVLAVAVMALVANGAVLNVPGAAAQTPAPAGSITFPADVMADYSIADAKSVTFAGVQDEFLVVGYVPKVFDPEGKVKSFMAVYKRTADGFAETFRYLPVPKADYPSPLTFENLWVVNGSNAAGQFGTVALATSWGEIGADYWGTHPIVFTYGDGAFKTMPLYQGNLADDTRIKGISWTTPDFDVTNQFDPKDTVKTILAQGMSVQGNTVTLSFFGDEACKACEHKMVDIDLNVGQ